MSTGLYCMASSNACFPSAVSVCNIPTTGKHTLQRSTLCTMTSEVIVAAGTTLNVSSVGGSGEMQIF
jgi:hypothetical protein